MPKSENKRGELYTLNKTWYKLMLALSPCHGPNGTFFSLLQEECENCKNRKPAFSYGEISPFWCDRLKTVKIKCTEHDERFVALLQLFCKILVCIEEVDIDRQWVSAQPPDSSEL